jgi:DNA anti-recombination protein RmuC
MNDYLTFTNIWFFSAIGILFLWDFWTWIQGGGKNHKQLRGEIVAIGIIGTFWGISVGLYGFDVDNIQASVPKLLTGMKTAFATSIVGMTASWLLGILQVLKPSDSGTTGNPIVDKLAENGRKLEEMFESTNKANAELSDQMKLLRQNAKEDSEMVAKTITEGNQHLGETMKDSLKDVNNTLQQAMEKLSEGASKEIIKALESVIREFNDNLKEQFGDNFNQLNEACKELVIWQENYRTQIEGHEKAISLIIESIDGTKDSLSKIAERNTEFEGFCNAVKEQLSTGTQMLDGNLVVSKNLSETLETMNTSAEKFAELPQEIQNLNQGLDKHLKNSTELIETTNSKLESHIEKAGDSMGTMRKEMEVATENLNNALVSLTKQFGDNYKVFLSSLEKLMINSNQPL